MVREVENNTKSLKQVNPLVGGVLPLLWEIARLSQKVSEVAIRQVVEDLKEHVERSREDQAKREVKAEQSKEGYQEVNLPRQLSQLGNILSPYLQ